MRVDKRFIVGVGQTNGIASLDGSGTVPLAQIPNVSSSARTINAQTGTTYTFALTDGSGNRNSPLVTLTNAASITATVPPNSSVAFPVGTQIDVIRGGLGEVVFAPGSGVTINAPDGASSIRRQYSKVSLIKTATDTWDLCGDLLIPEFIIATGGTITTDGNYKIHTFTSSGTFTITGGSGTVESLVVAGGGGGGSFGNDGGGGAGGMIYTTPGATYTPGAYSVTVGAGGAFGAAGQPGSSGSSSSFDSITATGGGGGGALGVNSGAGLNGGSGGGGSYNNGAAGLGTVGQGNDGGQANNATGSGGGGAGAVGTGGGVTNGGAGGDGLSNSITGAAVFYAGGGGGGTGTGGAGGNGGGGNGGTNINGNAVAGTANTGGGGGGGGGSIGLATGASGGDGVVIVRYLYQ